MVYILRVVSPILIPHLLRDHMRIHGEFEIHYCHQWHKVGGGGESSGRNSHVRPINPGSLWKLERYTLPTRTEDSSYLQASKALEALSGTLQLSQSWLFLPLITNLLFGFFDKVSIP